MAGGTFVTQNKVRPGVYINFESISGNLGNVSDRGICAFPLILNWGAEGIVTEVTSESNFVELFGYDLFDSSLFEYATSATPTTQLFYVREALKNSKTVYVYRVNTGVKATKVLGLLTCTAKYTGTKGNSISVAIQTNIDNPTNFDVITYVDAIERDKQIVPDIAGLVNNKWVDFSGTGALAVSAGTPLVGGTDGTVVSADYSNYISAIETYNFNTTGYCGTDSAIKVLFEAFVKRLREQEGRKIQVVMENYATADYEGIISVKNGVVLEDGNTLAAKDAVAWVVGATAGANVNESLTYRKYDGAVNVNTRYSNSEIITALQNGEFVFTVNSNDDTIVEQDINSFISYTAEKGKNFSKNRVVRVLDTIANDSKKIYETYFIGKVDNNADGRNLFKKELIKYMETLQGINAVQNFDAKNDIEVIAGIDSDSVVANITAQPVDSIEKFYITVKIM